MSDNQARWYVRVYKEPIVGCPRTVHYVVFDRTTDKPVPLDFFHTQYQAETQAAYYNEKGHTIADHG